MPELQVVARIVAWGVATVIVVLSIVPPSLRPETGLPNGLEHFVIYCVTGIAFALAYDIKPALLVTVLVIFSAAVEAMQLFVPGRHARVSDFIVDALASVVGLITASLVAQMRDRKRI